ncbi:MAG: PAS domain S-box protein [Desulfobacterales bacterium]
MPARLMRHSLVSKLIVGVGLTLMVTIGVWAYFNIEYQKQNLMEHKLGEAVRLGRTIRLGTHFAMMHNSRDDINEIINNIARQQEIETIRIYNKAGEIKFTNRIEEVNRTTNIKAEACDVCHRFDPPVSELASEKRTRIFSDTQGDRHMGIITPIWNQAGCATDVCHVHPSDKKVLGALDVILSLRNTDREILVLKRGIITLALVMFLIASTTIVVLMLRFVNRPIRRLIGETRRLARGDYSTGVPIRSEDEIGQLAIAFNRMGLEIATSQAELRRQKEEYQTLFEMVPCEITLQDRDFRLLNYNRRFAEKFHPMKGDYCYHAYKGRSEKCENCLVERTFQEGAPQFGEETGIDQDGNTLHWLAVASPMKDAEGRIVAAMEMNLDLTQLKSLETRLRQFEKKYQAIFDNIPNPIFVLDAETLEIVDCNDSVTAVYGYEKHDIIQTSFLDFFYEKPAERIAFKLRNSVELNQERHVAKDGRTLTVNIRISPSESEGRRVLLVTTSDITKRLEVEQQLIHASKMATLGEMATGVAHELNQPLSVIKMASGFFLKKLENGEPIEEGILRKLAEQTDSHIRRATRIINHMREFGRKSSPDKERINLNEVLHRALEIFSQQLKVRGIEVRCDLDPELPDILADGSRMEQVFINLLINARDAIEEYAQAGGLGQAPGNAAEKWIDLRSRRKNGAVVVEVEDSGPGIPEALREKIFEPFFTTKEVGKGTGLGLSISYGIIKDCGGTIHALPGRSGGACFVLRFRALEPMP